MHRLPHVYTAVADGAESGSVELKSDGLPALAAEPPPQFGGEGKQWSPEGLLCAAVASCFILSFRAVARAARLDWQKLECKVDGTLQRESGVLRFTRLSILATLTVEPELDFTRHRRALEQAERGCLVANSVSAVRELEIQLLPSAAARPSMQVAALGPEHEPSCLSDCS